MSFDIISLHVISCAFPFAVAHGLAFSFASHSVVSLFTSFHVHQHGVHFDVPLSLLSLRTLHVAYVPFIALHCQMISKFLISTPWIHVPSSTPSPFVHLFSHSSPPTLAPRFADPKPIKAAR